MSAPRDFSEEELAQLEAEMDKLTPDDILIQARTVGPPFRRDTRCSAGSGNDDHLGQRRQWPRRRISAAILF